MFMAGHEQTVHEGRIYQLKLFCDKDYPDKPPTVRFHSRINMNCVSHDNGMVLVHSLSLSLPPLSVLIQLDLSRAGGPKEIWVASKLAERVLNGGYIDTIEEGNGLCTKSQVGPATRRHFLLNCYMCLHKYVRTMGF